MEECFDLQTLDLEQYYTGNDVALLADNIMMDISFLTMNWKYMLGRPLYTIIASSRMIGQFSVQPTNSNYLNYPLLLYCKNIRRKLNLIFFSSCLCVCVFTFVDQGKIPLAMITTIKKLKSGYINGTR